MRPRKESLLARLAQATRRVLAMSLAKLQASAHARTQLELEWTLMTVQETKSVDQWAKVLQTVTETWTQEPLQL